MQRVCDNKTVLENTGFFLKARRNSPAAKHFAQVIQSGRYRGNASLNESQRIHESTYTYSELITSILWELVDNNESLGILDVDSIESFMLLLETASMYEADVGKVSHFKSLCAYKELTMVLLVVNGYAVNPLSEALSGCVEASCSQRSLIRLSRHLPIGPLRNQLHRGIVRQYPYLH